ncbi:hypothetical protein Barb4_00944 [Bacteroidales bacterium Barb4]|nr:hypothetical protein Barb4_00944 [Bacteroidales bacterium Barb4]
MNTLTLEDYKEAVTNELEFWDSLPYPPSLSIEELRARVEEGTRQCERGETISMEDMMKKYAEWL